MPDGVMVRFPDDMPSEKIKGMILKKFPDIENQYRQQQIPSKTQQMPTEVQKPTAQMKQTPVTPQQPVQWTPEMQQKLERLNSQTQGSVALDALKGFGAGTVTGLSKLINGLTLGGSDLVQRKAFDKTIADKTKEMTGLDKTIDYMGIPLEMIGSVAPGSAILKGAKSLGAVKSAIPLASAAEGAIYGATGSDTLEELPKNIAMGSAFGAAVPASISGVKLLGRGGKHLTGMTTGAGSDAIGQAYNAGQKGSKDFIENMRGRGDQQKAIDIAKNGLREMHSKASNAYKQSMDKLKTDRTQLDFKPVRNKIIDLMNSFKTSKGDFIVGPETLSEMYNVNKTINDFYKKRKGVFDVEDMDALKRLVYDSVDPKSDESRRYVTGAYNAIKDVITEQAPTYAKIMKEYEENATLIKNIERTFSLGRNATDDTTLRKLNSVFRNNVNTNYGKRKSLLDVIPKVEEAKNVIAGQSLNDWTPRGISKLGGIGAGGAVFFNPKLAVGLPAFSPRLMGETAYKLGQSSKYGDDKYILAMQALLKQEPKKENKK